MQSAYKNLHKFLISKIVPRVRSTLKLGPFFSKKPSTNKPKYNQMENSPRAKVGRTFIK